MATVLTYINDSFGDKTNNAKIIFYSILPAITAYLFVKGEMEMFYIFAIISAVLFLGLLTNGISNVRGNKQIIMTINPFKLLYTIALTAICIIPQILIFGFVGTTIINLVHLPIDIPHFQLIFEIIVWAILGSIIFTSYLSFAKYLSPLDAFKYKVVFESCIDVLVSCVFFLPQLLLVDAILIGPIIMLCSYFNIPYTHIIALIYYSVVFVMNIPILAGFLAQVSFENIKENNRYYDDKFDIAGNVEDDIAERLQ